MTPREQLAEHLRRQLEAVRCAPPGVFPLYVRLEADIATQVLDTLAPRPHPFQHAMEGPLLELDILLAKLVQVVYDKCEAAFVADDPLPAIDTMGLDEARAVQVWARRFVPQ